MTRTPDDPSADTALTQQQATELRATSGRGARQEPGAGEDIQEDADTLEPAATHDRLNEGDDPKNDG